MFLSYDHLQADYIYNTILAPKWLIPGMLLTVLGIIQLFAIFRPFRFVGQGLRPSVTSPTSWLTETHLYCQSQGRNWIGGRFCGTVPGWASIRGAGRSTITACSRVMGNVFHVWENRKEPITDFCLCFVYIIYTQIHSYGLHIHIGS
jgi:hypothetical protein